MRTALAPPHAHVGRCNATFETYACACARFCGQIFFTFVMAFLIVAKPIGYNAVMVSCILLAANLTVFIIALRQQIFESKKAAILRDLKERVENFSQNMLGIVSVQRPTTVEDLVRCTCGDWAESQSDSKMHIIASLAAQMLDVNVHQEDKDFNVPPPFPNELQKSGEPFLIMNEGQLVQIQKRQEDGGWAYGVVMLDPKANAKAKAQAEILAKKSHRDSLERMGLGTVKGTIRRARKSLVRKFAPPDSEVKVKENAITLELSEKLSKTLDLNEPSTIAGWFPLKFTSPPSVEDMGMLQDFVEKADEDVLKPPETWSDKTNDLNNAIVDLDTESKEWAIVEGIFKGSLEHSLGKGNLKKLQGVWSIKRIENLTLWHSYAAKKRSLFLRAEQDGMEAEEVEDYEMKDSRLMFHGSGKETVPKICSQGFNRSFCGKNAVKYGKGVYFATNSSYSNRYAWADEEGVKRVFLCRVLVGEYCQGRAGQPVPDERDASRHVLFDSTTDYMDDERRNMFVTYHDAQAYPEYLLEYSMEEAPEPEKIVANPPSATPGAGTGDVDLGDDKEDFMANFSLNRMANLPGNLAGVGFAQSMNIMSTGSTI